MEDFYKQAQQKILADEMSLDDLNALSDEIDRCDWTVLRGMYNDRRFHRLEKRFEKLVGNHVATIEKKLARVEDQLEKVKKRFESDG